MISPELLESTAERKKRRECQEKWRQKQLDIFYRTGKPVFTMTLDTQHIRSKNNPYFFVENEYY
jgi:hypothetical protein